MLKKIFMAALILCSIGAYAETWTNVPLIDSSCAAKVKNNPDAHTRACALQCAGSGYGIQTSDGRYLKFDKKGNDEALKLLKSTTKNDHLRVNVNGDPQGDTIAVKSITFSMTRFPGENLRAGFRPAFCERIERRLVGRRCGFKRGVRQSG